MQVSVNDKHFRTDQSHMENVQYESSSEVDIDEQG